MLKDIKDYEGLYAITDEGEVWSYHSKRFLKPILNRRGYYYVILYREGNRKQFAIHRLVLATFKPVAGMDSLQANHIDEDKLNNNLSNLEWTTAKENTQHSLYRRKGIKRGKIRRVEQYSLDGELIAVYKNQADASRKTNVNRYCISDVLRGRNKTGGGYIWRFADEGEENKENALCEG